MFEWAIQQDAVNDLRVDIANWDEVEHVRLLLVQQDVERIRWLVSSFMRTRLAKVCSLPPSERTTRE